MRSLYYAGCLWWVCMWLVSTCMYSQNLCTAHTVATGNDQCSSSPAKCASYLVLFLETCSNKLLSDTDTVCRCIVTLASHAICFYFHIREGMNILSIKFIPLGDTSILRISVIMTLSLGPPPPPS